MSRAPSAPGALHTTPAVALAAAAFRHRALPAATHGQQRLVRYAAVHHNHAEPRPEGDVAVFIQLARDGQLLPLCEVEVVRDLAELRAVLGY